MATTVKIPCVNRDERIGSVFNDLFVIINATDNVTDDDVIWDFQHNSFFHPFFLAPLSIYLQNCTKAVTFVNCPIQMKGYLNAIHFEHAVDYVANGEACTLNGYATKSYTPVCSFKANDIDASEQLQRHLQDVLKSQTGYDERLRGPLAYLLSELVDNISQHSNASKGYIFSQIMKHENSVDICIADNGITVYSSYVNSGFYITDIGTSEATALLKANSGYSTKSANERGYGLKSSRTMLTEGLGGDFFMLSGGAFLRMANGNIEAINLPQAIRWDGTIVLLRIPLTVGNNFNLIQYLE